MKKKLFYIINIINFFLIFREVCCADNEIPNKKGKSKGSTFRPYYPPELAPSEELLKQFNRPSDLVLRYNENRGLYFYTESEDQNIKDSGGQKDAHSNFLPSKNKKLACDDFPSKEFKKEEDLTHLLEIYKLCESFINKHSAKDILKKIESYANTDNIEEAKCADRLLKIYELCNNFIKSSNALDVNDLLIKIAHHAAKISHNTGSNTGITYSTVETFEKDRNLRENDINLIEFKHLGNFLDKASTEISLSLYMQEIKEDFIKIKNKILFIFFQEKSSLNKNSDLFNKLEQIFNSNTQPINLEKAMFIPKLSHFYYDQLILDSILAELSLFNTSTDFSKREDRYYWGSILVKIEEFLNPHELSDSYDLLDTFRHMTALREKLIHCHLLLVNTDKQHQELFYQYAKNLFDSLKIAAQELLKNIRQQELELFMSVRLTSAIKNSLEESTSNLIRFFTNFDKQNNIILLERCIIDAADYLIKKQKTKHEILEKLSKEYEDLLKIIELPPHYPKKLNQSNRNNVLEAAEIIKKKREKIKNTAKINMEEIIKEIDYIRDIERSKNLSEEKKIYITQYAEIVVNEYKKEIKKKALSTNTLKEAGRTSIFQSNLTYEPLSLYATVEGLHINILPTYHDYQVIYTIGQNSINKEPKTAIILNHVGKALLNLGFYREAIDYFKKAIHDIQDSSTLSNLTYHQNRIDQYKLKNINLTPPTAICIDMTKTFFGVSILELLLANNILYSLLAIEDLQQAYNISCQLLNKITLDKLERYKKTINFTDLIQLQPNKLDSNLLIKILGQENSELLNEYNRVIEYTQSTQESFVLYHPSGEILNQFSSMVGSIAYAHYQQGQYLKAVEFYQKALKIAINNNITNTLLLNLAHSYYQSGDEEKAQECIDLVNNNGSVLDQFSIRLLKCSILLDKNNPEANQEIELLNKMLEEKRGEFKELVGDKLWIHQLALCKLKLRLSALNKFDYSKVEDLIKKGLNLTKKNPKNDRFSTEVSTFYCYASRALSHLVLNKQPLIFFNIKQILKQAENYFEEGKKQIIPLLLMVQKNAARDLATAYSNYVIASSELPFCERIEILEKAKKLQEDYEIEAYITNLNLGCEYHNYAEFFYCQKNYKKAMPRYQKAIVILNSILGQHLSNSEVLSEGLKVLAMSYEGLGDCKNDLDSLEKAKDLYSQFITKYANHSDYQKVISYVHGIQKKIDALRKHTKN